MGYERAAEPASAPVALRPLRIGEILDVAVKVYKGNAKTLCKLVFIIVAPVQALTQIVLLSALPEQDANLQPGFEPGVPGQPSNLDGGDFGVFFAALGIVVVLGLVSAALATGACFKTVADAYLGGEPQWRDSLRFVARRLRSILWITLLVGIGVLLAAIALILPGVWLWVSWSVAVPVLLMEQARGSSAMRRSFRLVKSRWWPTFGVLVVSAILTSIISGVITGLAGALLFTDVGSNSLLAGVVDWFSGTLASVITTPFSAAVVVILYFDLRVRKEGFDLQLLAEQLGMEPTEDALRSLLPGSPPPAAGRAGDPPYWPPPPGWRPPEPPPDA